MPIAFVNFSLLGSVGRPKHTRVLPGALQGEYFIGPKAEQYRGLLKLQHPLSHGVVEDWDAMERIWAHLYHNELKISPEEVAQSCHCS